MGLHHTYFEKAVQFVEPNWVTNSHPLCQIKLCNSQLIPSHNATSQTAVPCPNFHFISIGAVGDTYLLTRTPDADRSCICISNQILPNQVH